MDFNGTEVIQHSFGNITNVIVKGHHDNVRVKAIVIQEGSGLVEPNYFV